VHVPPAPPWYAGGSTPYTVGAVRELAREVLDRVLADCAELAPDVDSEGALPLGTRVQAIVDESRQACCVVLGTRDRGLHRTLGSTTSGVAGHSDCPVIAVPPSWSAGVLRHRVVTGFDCNHGADAVLDHAFAEASLRASELVIVHAWRPDGVYEEALTELNQQRWQPTAARALAEATATVRAGYPGVTVRELVVWAKPADAVVEAARDADLLVLGRHHEGPLPALHRLGAVAHAALGAMCCPVEIVPVTDGENA